MSKPTHFTQIATRKYQCNGPQDWSATFKALAEKIGGKGTPEGVGIRAVLAAGVAAAKKGAGSVATLGTEMEEELAKERAALQVTIAKKLAKAAPKAKKPTKAKPKAAKAKKSETEAQARAAVGAKATN